MLCNKCGKNEATVYYRQNINGEVSETALCAKCAGKMGIGYEPSDFFAGGSLLDSFFSEPFALPTRRLAEKSKVCPLCGATYGDIVKANKTGCARCYETFRDELAGTIERLHGRVKHIGRAPAEHAAQRRRQTKLEQLKRSMADAVDKQDFEKAAGLRDEIAALEKENGGEARA